MLEIVTYSFLTFQVQLYIMGFNKTVISSDAVGQDTEFNKK